MNPRNPKDLKTLESVSCLPSRRKAPRAAPSQPVCFALDFLLTCSVCATLFRSVYGRWEQVPLRNDVAANWWRRPIRGGAGLPRPSFSFAYYIKGLRPFIHFFQQTFVEHLLCAEEEKVVARAHTHTHTQSWNLMGLSSGNAFAAF